MRYFLCLFLIGAFNFSIGAVGSAIFSQPIAPCEKDTIVPKVFMIGEYERQYEELMGEHGTLLLTACNDDMNVAFEKWQGMLIAMEEHSEGIGYDLKGVKLWLNIFWEEDGGIAHIAYYLKPNSRNVDTDRLSMFFVSFINNYRFPLVVGEKFSHYGMATFPTFSRRSKGKTNVGGAPLVKDSANNKNNNR